MLLEMSSAAPLAGGSGAKVDEIAGSKRPANCSTRAAILKLFPDAHDTAVYDGRRLIGRLVALEQSRTAYAFDDGDRLLGEFPSRVVALRAVFARDRFEGGRA